MDVSKDMDGCWQPMVVNTQENGNQIAVMERAKKPGQMETGSKVNSYQIRNKDMVSQFDQGHFQWVDGNQFEGGFKNGEYDGFGIYKWKNDKTYEGDWKEGKMHGKGKLVYANGDSYEGKFFKGKKHGKGIFKWAADGSYYDGEWNNNHPHGVGFVGKDNKSKRKAMYEDGKNILWLDKE